MTSKDVTQAPLFETITIIGMGLIGSSIARAARERHLASVIVGCDRNEVSLAYARKHGFIDKAVQDPQTAVQSGDLVIIATPPSTLEDIATAIAPNLKEGAVVMDTCSVKQLAIESIAPHLPNGVYFMPCHPIAGSHQTGVSAGRANLFDKKRVIVTPDDPSQNSHVLECITGFWHAIGARLEGMPPHLHDMIYAYVSHLPQLLAFIASRPLPPQEQQDTQNTALQKFTRLAGSDMTLWVDIFLSNRQHLGAALDRYIDVIAHIADELKAAPEDSPPQTGNSDAAGARTALFPRIAASCLITTVMEAEKKAGFSFARFAGSGFADFTYPVTHPPEEDIEQISNQYGFMIPLLEHYRDELILVRTALESGSEIVLRQSLGNAA